MQWLVYLSLLVGSKHAKMLQFNKQTLGNVCWVLLSILILNCGLLLSLYDWETIWLFWFGYNISILFNRFCNNPLVFHVLLTAKSIYCCNLSVVFALNAWFTMNGMCAKNNTNIYVAQTSNNRVISSGDLYCCLQPQCEALHTCHLGFPIATNKLCKNIVISMCGWPEPICVSQSD